MDTRQLTDLIQSGTPVSLIVEAIQWPHQAMRRRWDLTGWHVVARPVGVLFWQTADPEPLDTPTALRLREAEAERKKLAAQLAALRRSGQQYFGGHDKDSQLQYWLNDLDHEISDLKRRPDAPPEVRGEALASAIANLKRRAESLRHSAEVYRHNAAATGGDPHLEALGGAEEAAAAEATSEAERLQQELDGIAIPEPIAGILLIKANEDRREEYEQVAAGAGYPITVLLRNQWQAGPARTALDAITEGILR